MNEVTAVRLDSVAAFAPGIANCVAERISQQPSDLLMHRARAGPCQMSVRLSQRLHSFPDFQELIEFSSAVLGREHPLALCAVLNVGKLR
ncbi:hypothetical protein XH80_04425 [Bradyrhizobium sp. CCBAU 45384]|nr:hypothetical protein [Bradyrhizobium sp. CCBAU 45384]